VTPGRGPQAIRSFGKRLTAVFTAVFGSFFLFIRSFGKRLTAVFSSFFLFFFSLEKNKKNGLKKRVKSHGGAAELPRRR
jgi:hypothetical protein